MKYKVGDYVRIKKNIPFGINGHEGKVSRVVKVLSDNMVVVIFDGDDIKYHMPVNTIECKVASKGGDVFDKEKELINFAKNRNDKKSRPFKIPSWMTCSITAEDNNGNEFIMDNIKDSNIYVCKDSDNPFLVGMTISSSRDENAEHFAGIAQRILETYIKKNHDYGSSFDQSLDKHGLIASIVRMSDKMNRLETLVEKESEVKDESISDTLLDLANYCIMTKMWIDNKDKSC